MRIAIIDDKKEDRMHLQSLVEHYCTNRDLPVQITQFSSGEELLKQFQPGSFECIFLDIFMSGMDGMETARIIYRKDPECRLIFSTISISHAVASYEVRAAWYLTKPIDMIQLTNAMNIACAHLIATNQLLTFHVKGTELCVGYKDIYFIDCANRKALLHMNDRTIKVDETVSFLTKQLLKDTRFLMCNRNTIVNMDHIKQASENDFVMKNGSHVPIRQRGRAALKKSYLTWTLRDLRKEGSF